MFWKNDNSEKIEELEEKIEDLTEEVERWKKRYQKCDEKRSQLARKKQEAEEERNKLRDKLESLKKEETLQKNETETELTEASLEDVKQLLSLMNQIESESETFVTCYHNNSKENKDKLASKVYSNWFDQVKNYENFIGFFGNNLISYVIKSRPFYKEAVINKNTFDFTQIKEFIEKEKIWVVVEAGESKIIKESDGEYEILNTIKNRINRQHSKGGFSQSRFERKREEQIENHIKELKSVLKKFDEFYLIGNQRICKKIDAEYWGGFDDNKNLINSLYNFRFKKLHLQKQ